MQLVVDGILTNYHVVGDRQQTILILHGWQRSLQEWLPIAKTLSKTYKVVLLDLPGFGKTPRPEQTFSMDDYADFVTHFIEKLSLKQITLIGHSFGGRIGIILGAKTDKLAKLVLVDSAAIEKKNAAVKFRIFINKILAFPIKLFFPISVEKLKSRFGSDDYQAAGNMRDIFIKTVNEDLTPFLNKITIKTLIIWGEKDTTRPLSEAKIIKNEIPHSKLRIVWNAGHSPYLEKPKEFLEILTEWL